MKHSFMHLILFTLFTRYLVDPYDSSGSQLVLAYILNIRFRDYTPWVDVPEMCYNYLHNYIHLQFSAQVVSV